MLKISADRAVLISFFQVSPIGDLHILFIVTYSKRCKWREQIFETKGDALCRVTLIQNYRQKMNRKLFPILQWKLAAGMFILTLLWWGEILRVQTLNIVRLTSILTQTCLNFFIIFGRNVVQLKKIDQQKEIHKWNIDYLYFSFSA